MDDFSKFIKAELKCIDEAKWYEGERIHTDPGIPFVEKWTVEHAKEFRDKWNKSICKKCVSGHICGNYLKAECKDFNPTDS